ncbi:hypothetical protein GQS65_11100 [Halomarina oriensis]|uniref:Uncharacterized protein n=1 Tax=Halomarina oriensis TaxID=671145 RepID=A0A6B0GSE9_9EURY|nr:hypothetical protein [Halomarina oriensis]MWG35025.1 hypothetical protein [Halomarina oriensis]
MDVDDTKERVGRLAISRQTEMEMSHAPRADRLVTDDANEPPSGCNAVVVEERPERRNPDPEFRRVGRAPGTVLGDGVDEMASERSGSGGW